MLLAAVWLRRNTREWFMDESHLRGIFRGCDDGVDALSLRDGNGGAQASPFLR